MPSTGKIVTFYSWKGGAGRSMALANVSTQLARAGLNVLMVDWDLEAPGLERYFTNGEAMDRGKVQTERPSNNGGLLGLLQNACTSKGADISPNILQDKIWKIAIPPYEPTHSTPKTILPGRFHLLPSGHDAMGYANQLSNFSWSKFFLEHQGGEWMENFRELVRSNYDFVLIDSRTGLTDNGGICTIQMPDIVALVFTSNDESLEGGLKVIDAAQKAREDYAYDRAPLLVLPLLSRWDGENEVDLAQQWMSRFDEMLKPLVASWLPASFSPRQFLERTRIPHVARFSFGEPLPVLTHSLTDTNLPGLSYEVVSRVLRTDFADAATIIDPTYRQPAYLAGYSEAEDIKLLSLVGDQSALYQTIDQMGRKFGADSDEVSRFLSSAGQMLFHTARYIEAEPLYRRALAIDEKKFGSDDQSVGSDLMDLSILLQHTNRFKEAEPLIRRALTIAEKSFGSNHANVGAALNNLAGLLRETGQLEEAESLYRRALIISENSFGPDHPNVAAALNNLAGLLRVTRRLDEAEVLYRRALAIDEKSFSPDHPSVATALNNLAGLLEDMNRFQEAEPLYRRALAIDEKSFGPDHPDVAVDLNNLAGLLARTRRFLEAEPLYSRALAIYESSLGSEHPRTTKVQENLTAMRELRDEMPRDRLI